MSRSFKKNWCSKNNTSGMKKIANHKVRNYDDDIANGKSYRKIFCSYNISDYRSTCFGKENEAFYEKKKWNQWRKNHGLKIDDSEDLKLYKLYGK